MESIVGYGLLLVASKVFPFLKCLCKEKLTAVIIPRKCGKSQTLNSFNIDSSQYLFYDLESNMDSSLSENVKNRLIEYNNKKEYINSRNLILPFYHEHVQNLMEKFPKKKIVLFLSDTSLAKEIGVQKIYYFCPSSNFLNEIKQHVTDLDKPLLDESVACLQRMKYEKIVPYKSFEELQEAIGKIFKLKIRY